MRDYYSYSAEELMRCAKTPVLCMPSSEAVFMRLASEMLAQIEENNAAGKQTVFICPVGPVGQYPYFVEAVNARRLSLKSCWFFNMDEYLDEQGDWIGQSDRLSFRGFMAREVYGKIDPALLMPEEQRVFPDPKNPGAQAALLSGLGGADICFGGIGINGHLAFNEPQPALSPEAFAALSVRTLFITPETRTANAIGDLGGAIEDMPRLAVTIGMKEILAARKVRIGVFRPWHRAVLRRAACDEVSAAFPATLLQRHADAILFANDVAAGKPVS